MPMYQQTTTFTTFVSLNLFPVTFLPYLQIQIPRVAPIQRSQNFHPIPAIVFHSPKTVFSAKKRGDSAWALGRIASCLNALHLSAPPVVSNLSHLLHFNLIVSSLIGNTNPVAHILPGFWWIKLGCLFCAARWMLGVWGDR